LAGRKVSLRCSLVRRVCANNGRAVFSTSPTELAISIVNRICHTNYFKAAAKLALNERKVDPVEL